MNSEDVVSRKSNLVERELEGEILLYDLDEDKAHCLNPTAARIWELIDGEKTISEISLEYQQMSGQSPEFVEYFVSELSRKSLIEGDRFEVPGNRRSFLRKAALAGTVALPLISSLVVPSAAQAQSALPPGSPCQSRNQCLSGNCVGTPGPNPKICA